MSDKNNENLDDNLKGKAKKAMDAASEKASEMKEEAKEAFEGAREKASEMAGEAKEAAKDTANEMKESWNQATNSGENKKLVAGILGIVLGAIGIHKFILGYTQEGIITIVISIVTCGIGGQLIGLIEGIIYLTKSDEEFYQTYQIGKKGWF
jgi:TM2 domain-containing membrane protein YozV